MRKIKKYYITLGQGKKTLSFNFFDESKEVIVLSINIMHWHLGKRKKTKDMLVLREV